jgi:diguanylate cyclase (GGDEF)-like protein/PAS domain S-box-containing protein
MSAGSASPTRYAAEWLALVLGLCATALLIGYVLHQGHDRTSALEHDRLVVQARVIDEHLGQHLGGIDKALNAIRAEFAASTTERPGSSTARLKTLTDALPGVRNMFLLDRHGTVTSSSEPVLIGRNFHDREYFDLPSRQRDPQTLHVSPPFRSFLGSYVLVVGHALAGPTGEFEGVVVAALDAGYFEVILRSVLYAGDMWSALAHADGKVFLGAPYGAAPIDLEGLQAPPVLRERNGADEPLLFLTPGDDTAGTRLVAARTVAPPALHMDKALVVLVSRGEDAIYQGWREQAAGLGGFFGVLLLASTTVLHRSQGRRRAFDRLEASASAERARSAERLETALRGAELGLWDWDVVNDRFIGHELTRRWLGYAAGEIAPDGAAWRELVHPEDAVRMAQTFQAHLRGATESCESEFRGRHKDGRWVWLLSRGKVVERAPDGRAVRMAGTHMDISERKRIELELQRLNARLTELSTQDGLTEVGNRRLFDQTLQAEWARAARKRHDVALLMIDIDHFKDYNDRYGHPAGDDCLRTVARLISETVKREGELVARYGGEEFALLLPGADLAAARGVGERCLQALERAAIPHAASAPGIVTLSIGVASAVAGAGIDPSVLLDAADAALYRAKRGGRGRCEA